MSLTQLTNISLYNTPFSSNPIAYRFLKVKTFCCTTSLSLGPYQCGDLGGHTLFFIALTLAFDCLYLGQVHCKGVLAHRKVETFNSHSAAARHSRRTRFSSATVVCPSSPVGGSLLGARFDVFVPSPSGLSTFFWFSLPFVLRGRPLPAAEDFGPPFTWTGVFGPDNVDEDLPVAAFDVASLFLLVGAMG